jgi:N-carbamoylputrescine amidase
MAKGIPVGAQAPGRSGAKQTGPGASDATRAGGTPGLRIGLVQMRCSERADENLVRALAGIEDAAARGACLVCLPELFRTPYFCQAEDATRFDLAEPVPGPTTEAVAKVAAARGVTVVASVFERRAGGLYHNTAVVLDADGRVAGVYRKMHIPDDPLYYEKFYFTPGDLGFQAFDTRAGRVGTLVCWDQWFPEAARLAALAGAQVLVYPTAIGWETGARPEWEAAEHDAWETVQRAHAIANGVFVAAVNRMGVEGRLTFWGQSFVADPFGRVIARASAREEETLVVDCDLSLVEEVRRGWPFLRDRRIDAYGDLLKRFRD